MQHTMTPTGVACLLLLALVVDYMSIGPNSWRDRLAFLIALPVVREGFDDSPLDRWTVDALGDLIDTLLKMADGAYIAGASINALIGAAVSILFLYTIGALLPDKLSTKLGRFATLSFPTSPMKRINIKLWICAIFLGMLADLPRGLVGDVLTMFIDALVSVTALLPELLFGVI